MRWAFPDALYFDLLESDLYAELLASPSRLEGKIPTSFRGHVIIDEVQRVPAILDEVHRLIERKKVSFVLTGSSARKLKRAGVNLLAGRALNLRMHPLTAVELGAAFSLQHSLRYGQMPAAYVDEDPAGFLAAYAGTYLREEVLQEGLVRNVGAFARFLESMTLAQAQVLNISSVARDCAVERKVVEGYVEILEDLLLGVRLPVFTKRAKRRVTSHPKFFFFDAGVYRAMRPKGPLDTPEEIDGAALETLAFQELRAHIDYGQLGYELSYFRTSAGHEVDLVLYGERGLHGIEVKRAGRLRAEDFKGLQVFKEDYPMARCTMLYGGTKRYTEHGVEVIPFDAWMREIPSFLSA